MGRFGEAGLTSTTIVCLAKRKLAEIVFFAFQYSHENCASQICLFIGESKRYKFRLTQCLHRPKMEMNINGRLILFLIVLVLVEIVSFYQTLFSVWMMAHPIYESQVWMSRLRIQVGITFFLACLIVIVVAKLFVRPGNKKR